MTKEKLRKLVDEAVLLQREVAAKTAALKALKASLIEEAEKHPEAQTVNERGGRRWTALGSDGCLARVSFPADGLLAEIEGKSEEAQRCHELAGENFRNLFTTVKSYQLVEDFRSRATAALSGPKAEALLAILTTENSPRVSFEAAKRTESASAR